MTSRRRCKRDPQVVALRRLLGPEMGLRRRNYIVVFVCELSWAKVGRYFS